ncbi:hypothetical protein [Pacificibacter sp. 1_MG-2023]|nr:hypothetical protein [Pacificibacter sp. 1_MG-2023]MBU2936633.1 hypothetical protein [Pacificibacter marinus]MDO6614564.1 hypothetical protein [Pacificibacter sp. 1_MG-2023]
MLKMVIQAVILSAAALFFIFSKSDGLRAASKTGDLSSLAQVADNSHDTGLSDLGVISERFQNGVNWAKYDPRRLWQDRPKSIRLNTKTIRVDPTDAGQDLVAIMAAKGLDPSTVTTVQLD